MNRSWKIAANDSDTHCQTPWSGCSETSSCLIDLEVLEDDPVIVEKVGDVLDEDEVVSSPSKLRLPDLDPHPSEELDIEGRTIELFEFPHSFFQTVEAPLSILEKPSPVRIRNETCGLPAPVNPVELATLRFEDLWKDAEGHVTVGSRKGELRAGQAVRSDRHLVAGRNAGDQESVDHDGGVGEHAARPR